MKEDKQLFTNPITFREDVKHVLMTPQINPPIEDQLYKLFCLISARRIEESIDLTGEILEHVKRIKDNIISHCLLNVTYLDSEHKDISHLTDIEAKTFYKLITVKLNLQSQILVDAMYDPETVNQLTKIAEEKITKLIVSRLFMEE